MFYLKIFIKAIWENMFWGGAYLLWSGALVVVLLNQDKVNDLLKDKIKGPENFSYFYLLVSTSEDHEDATSKLRELEEVKRIETLSKDIIKEEVRKILGELNEETLNQMLNIDYVGLKVIFASNVTLKAQGLVREYAERLIGKNNLILGDVRKNIDVQTEETSFLEDHLKYVYPLMLSVVILCWLISFAVLRKQIGKISYLIEQYQRKNNVLLKTILIGSMFIFIPLGFIPASNWINVFWLLLVVLVLITFSLKKNMWES